MEKLFLVGVSNETYSQIHHIGSEKDCLITFNALKNGAKSARLNESAIYFIPVNIDKAGYLFGREKIEELLKKNR